MTGRPYVRRELYIKLYYGIITALLVKNLSMETSRFLQTIQWNISAAAECQKLDICMQTCLLLDTRMLSDGIILRKFHLYSFIYATNVKFVYAIA